jgi:excisionase family DNA binding protein
VPSEPAPLDLDALADIVAAKVAERLSGRPAPRFLTVRQAAEYTALSQDSIRSMLARGRLTALRPVQGRVVIDLRELDAVVTSSSGRPRTGRGIRQPGAD